MFISEFVFKGAITKIFDIMSKKSLLYAAEIPAEEGKLTS